MLGTFSIIWYESPSMYACVTMGLIDIHTLTFKVLRLLDWL